MRAAGEVFVERGYARAAIAARAGFAVETVYRSASGKSGLLAAAAGSDEELAALRDSLDGQRWEGQLRFAQALVDSGTLRPGLTAETAADVIYTLQSPAVHDSLVLDRGWPAAAYRDWLADLLARALLDT